MSVVNVILAGGASRRFGEPKASHMYQGKPLYEHVKKQLLDGQTIIISHPVLLPFFEARGEQAVWLDDEQMRGCGPLAGIYTAMQKQDADWYLVTACDMPFIRKRDSRGIIVLLQRAYRCRCPACAGQVTTFVCALSPPLSSVYSRVFKRETISD